MTRMLSGALAVILTGAAACAGSPAAPRSAPGAACDAACVEAAVTAVLAEQQDAWNRGDIPGFMDHYWKSEELRFASGGQITTGWTPTLERYLARYDTPEKMGVLTFEILDVDVLSPDAALVFGSWRLDRAEDAPHGLFTLTFKTVDGRWAIVADHTSSAD